MVNLSHSKLKLWQSMQSFRPAVQIESIKFGSRSAFSGQSVDFAPFTVICGLHGSGKSTLVNYLAEGLCRNVTSSDQPPFVGRRKSQRGKKLVMGGEVELSLRCEAALHALKADLDSADSKSPGTEHYSDHVCSYLYTPYDSVLIGEFFDNYDFSSSLEEHGKGWVQKRADLNALREILGVTYDAAVYTPANIVHLAPTFPFVRARAGDAWVDSSSMSFGELAIHRLRWEVANPYPNTVILLDEPEANIAPRGHAPLLDELARLARASNVQIIMATHSPSFINRVPLSFVRICVRRGQTVSIYTPTRPSDLRDVLGAGNPLNFFVVVEDQVAEAALRMILTAHSFLLLSETEILKVGSWTDVIATTSGLSNSRRTRTVAVIDGDQRQSTSQLKANAPIRHLPGSQPPEKVFLDFAGRYPEKLAAKLDCSLSSMSIYLAELVGEEHHRWLARLSERTGHDWRFCLRAAFEIWHTDPENTREAEALTRKIEEDLLR
jgi:energy-coupling factor transporter ATP-binding protein EcfA2